MTESVLPLSKELRRFLLVGISAVATDFGIYRLLFVLALLPSVAKGCSFIAGTLVAFILNKYWTFQRPQHSTREILCFAGLYTFSLAVNIEVNHALLRAYGSSAVFIAFLGATSVSMVINFMGQKHWVFRAAPSSAMIQPK